MKHEGITTPGKRRPVNLSLDPDVVAAARDAGVNLSRVTEAALRIAVKTACEDAWRVDNREAIERFNAWYDQNGDPLAHLAAL